MTRETKNGNALGSAVALVAIVIAVGLGCWALPAGAEVHGPDIEGLSDSAVIGRDLTRELQPLPFLQRESSVPAPDLVEAIPGGSSATKILSDLRLEGTVSYLISGGFVNMTADRISNYSSGRSGTISLELWATVTYPSGPSVTYYELGSYQMDPLDGGWYYYDVDVTVPYTPPPRGCYYITMAILEYQGFGEWTFTDLQTFANREGLSGGSCGTSCVESLSNGLECLQDGRFQLAMTWTDFDGMMYPIVFKTNGSSNPVAQGTIASSPNDVLVVVKVTKGCSLNGYWWVWVGGFTKAGLDLQITDLQTGRSGYYHKDAGELMTTVKDMDYFPCP
jgi:hypothetical protein